MKKILTLIVAVTITQPVAVEAQSVSVQWSAISGGFMTAAAQSGRMLTMSAGQSFVEVSSGSNRIVESGFLVHPVLRDVLVSVPQQGELPQTFNLQQNYPNPFNPSTTIQFEIANETNVSLKVFNMLGQEVATLVNERLNPGRYERSFDGKGLASGVYFYRLTAGSFTDLKKLVLLK